ncbi:hypothetical protein BGW80DRAFT_1459517 [Lactifluus volemus]|nr:hypothetical protein BGW80DRAFT_1459517 [Lactifluus volemus]
MKQAVGDLRALMLFGELDDREILADSLAEFLICARNLRKSLVRFYSRVRDTLDSVLLARGHALRVMEGTSPELPSLDGLKTDRLALGAETPLADIITLEELLENIQVAISSYTSQKNFDKVDTHSTYGRHLERTE